MRQYFKNISLVFLFCFSACLSAVEFPQPVIANAVSEETSIQPGRPFWVAVTLDIDEGWHAYWKNPGANGFSPSIDWNLPEGFEVAEVVWPTPERIEVHEGVVYGYHEILTLLVKVVPPEGIEGEAAQIEADISWLVCSENTCLPGKQALKLDMPVGENLPEVNQDASTVFAEARKRQPVKHSSLQAYFKGEKIELELSGHEQDFSYAYFYPEEEGLLQDESALDVTSANNRHKFFLPLNEGQDLSVLKGVLVLEGQGDGAYAIDVEIPLQKSVEELAYADIASLQDGGGDYAFQGGFLWALVLAFGGGLILNLMPCVLPVISLKIFSFVKMAGENRWEIAKHGLLFTLGVLVSFWALAGFLILLQSTGQTVGWGFQLQEPLFVGFLAVLLYVFGLSLFGMFEVGTMFSAWAGQKQSDSAKKSSGMGAAFFSGVLATAVATPCTGPLLGPAVGFAVTLSAPLSLLVFTSLALGMSFPYLLISAYPPLIRFLPKPGNWMIIFKEVIGFFMMATALWLVWVFEGQTGSEGMFGLLKAMLVLTFACWIYGKWGTPMTKRSFRLAATVAALGIAAGGLYMVAQAPTLEPAHSELIAMADTGPASRNIRRWEPFSLKRLAELREQGTPVFVDFTAKWCLICQTNHAILETQAVSDKFEEMGVVKMVADWTKSDPVITEVLKRYGRSGVPLYLLYGPDGKPEVLPQNLTPSIILSHLEHVKQ